MQKMFDVEVTEVVLYEVPAETAESAEESALEAHAQGESGCVIDQNVRVRHRAV